MEPNEVPNLINECKIIEENCLYTAAAHYVIEDKMARNARLFKYIPAALSVLGGSALILGQNIVYGWLPIIAGLATAMATALDVDKRTAEHKEAAKEYTILRHKTRAVYQAFVYEVNREEFAHTVKDLCERYNDLIRECPSTTEKAFKKGRRKIKAGDYKPDFADDLADKEASLAHVPKNKEKGVSTE